MDEWESRVVDYDHCEGFFCYGETGTGKTTWCKQQLGDARRLLHKHAGNKWFCGLKPRQHERLLVDDAVPQTFAALANDLLALGRGKISVVEIKGKSFQASFKAIYITSNYSLDQLCAQSNIAPETANAIKARFKSHHFARFPVAKPASTQVFDIKKQMYVPAAVTGN